MYLPKEFSMRTIINLVVLVTGVQYTSIHAADQRAQKVVQLAELEQLLPGIETRNKEEQAQLMSDLFRAEFPIQEAYRMRRALLAIADKLELHQNAHVRDAFFQIPDGSNSSNSMLAEAIGWLRYGADKWFLVPTLQEGDCTEDEQQRRIAAAKDYNVAMMLRFFNRSAGTSSNEVYYAKIRRLCERIQFDAWDKTPPAIRLLVHGTINEADTNKLKAFFAQHNTPFVEKKREDIEIRRFESFKKLMTVCVEQNNVDGLGAMLQFLVANPHIFNVGKILGLCMRALKEIAPLRRLEPSVVATYIACQRMYKRDIGVEMPIDDFREVCTAIHGSEYMDGCDLLTTAQYDRYTKFLAISGPALRRYMQLYSPSKEMLEGASSADEPESAQIQKNRQRAQFCGYIRYLLPQKTLFELLFEQYNAQGLLT
jgi:hypothetical protein